MNLGCFKVPEHAKIVQQLLHDFGTRGGDGPSPATGIHWGFNLPSG
jgi:hypothetical protein